MQDIIIEKIETVQPVMNTQEAYLIKHTKEVETVSGEKATIVDENRTEQVTVEGLEAQKASLQAQIKEIDVKLAEISKL